MRQDQQRADIAILGYEGEPAPMLRRNGSRRTAADSGLRAGMAICTVHRVASTNMAA